MNTQGNHRNIQYAVTCLFKHCSLASPVCPCSPSELPLQHLLPALEVEGERERIEREREEGRKGGSGGGKEESRDRGIVGGAEAGRT